jgi:endoglucanase
MNVLSVILPIILLISLILDFLYSMKKENSFEIVKKMGMGYNLANTFDSFSYYNIHIETPDEQIELNGNIAPTKDMIKKLKKYGFKTIRFPVTWMYFIDDEGNINSEWMARVKEVVDIIINEKLYCILNVHNDGYYTSWLIRGMEVKDKYINLWNQIANEFKDYNEYLIFESMDAVSFFDYFTFDFDYITLTNLNQAFVDTIRNSGGKNIERLLLIAGASGELEMTSSSKYKMPIDKSNKLAVSIQYFEPYDFVYEQYYEPYIWPGYDGSTISYGPKLIWGSSEDYYQMFDNFELMKRSFIDKGIPVIINKVGVLTKEKKEIESIREYLYMLFSLSLDNDGIVCCLWDTSNKTFGDMNFYDRTNDIWYDEKLKNNFLQISKRKNIKPKDYFINTNFQSTNTYTFHGDYQVNFENRKVLKVIIYARLNGVLFADIEFSIWTFNEYGYMNPINFGKLNSKKLYDGTHVFTIDVSKIKCYEVIELVITKGIQNITLYNLTLEYEENFLSIDYKSLKNDISNYIY